MNDLNSSFYSPFYFGQAGKRHANLNLHTWNGRNSGDQTHRAGDDGMNSNGLFGMCGNVDSWTDTRYRRYPDAPESDHPINDFFSYKSYTPQIAIRGGSWDSKHTDDLFFRSDFRGHLDEWVRKNSIGFRLALDLP